MKDLKDYVKSRTISLSGLDTNIVERLSNLSGRSINECCGCPVSDMKCCTDPGCDNVAWFYSENDIVRMLTTDPKSQDIFHVRIQICGTRFRHYDEKQLEKMMTEPLYFKQYAATLGSTQLSTNYASFNDNPKLYKFIEKLTSSLDLKQPIVLDLVGENLQLFFIYTKGSNNGTSIKNSLKDVAQLLEELEQYKEINWAQVLDVSIDNLDSLYDFVITVTCNKMKFLENLN